MNNITPLDSAHRAANGKLIDFASWLLPVHYGSILAEARAVREHAGIFDVSHMGRFLVSGPAAFETLTKLGTNDLSKAHPGRGQYTLWCEDSGEVLDDLIVYWLEPDEFLVVVNASNREKDFAHLAKHAQGCDFVDQTLDTAMIALQGPQAPAIAQRVGIPLATLKRFDVQASSIDKAGVFVSATGYTGEQGCEIICSAADAKDVWSALVAEGAKPCGLGARDILRMEMGYPLYGHELGGDIHPREAGVNFAVKSTGFIGADNILSVEPQRKLVGFTASRPCVPQPGDTFGDGVVTSGGTSVVLNKPMGLALIPRESEDTEMNLQTRGKAISCVTHKLPMVTTSLNKQKTS